MKGIQFIFPSHRQQNLDNLIKMKGARLMMRKSYTQEYKEEASDYVISSGKPAAQVARELGIGEQMLGRWVKARRLARGLDRAPVLTLEEKAEVKELRHRVRDLEDELAFLKKAAAFFAKDRR
jgi:transposase